MKYKVAELEGYLLDAAVAKALGMRNLRVENGQVFQEQPRDPWIGVYDIVINPSSDWRQGGPIIERERIRLMHEHGEGEDAQWYASCRSFEVYGPTILIAAMRVFVSYRLGDEVEL